MDHIFLSIIVYTSCVVSYVKCNTFDSLLQDTASPYHSPLQAILFSFVTSAQNPQRKSAMINSYEQETGGAFYGKETGAGFPKRVCGLRVLHEGMPAKGDFDSPGCICSN